MIMLWIRYMGQRLRAIYSWPKFLGFCIIDWRLFVYLVPQFHGKPFSPPPYPILSWGWPTVVCVYNISAYILLKNVRVCTVKHSWRHLLPDLPDWCARVADCASAGDRSKAFELALADPSLPLVLYLHGNAGTRYLSRLSYRIKSNQSKSNQIGSLYDRIIDHFTRSSFSRNLIASLPLVLCAAARPPIGLISTGAFSATDFKSWLSTIAVPLPLPLSLSLYCLLYSNRTCVQSRGWVEYHCVCSVCNVTILYSFVEVCYMSQCFAGCSASVLVHRLRRLERKPDGRAVGCERRARRLPVARRASRPTASSRVRRRRELCHCRGQLRLRLRCVQLDSECGLGLQL